MDAQDVFPFNLQISPEQAIQWQLRLRQRVRFCPLEGLKMQRITELKAMTDSHQALAVAITVDMVNWSIIDKTFAALPLTFPYIPGLYAFSVLPAMLEAFARLNSRGDVIIVEGHGFAHPRRFGLACHLGVALDTPTMGCARNLITGTLRPLEREAGSVTEIMDGEDVIGLAYRSQTGVKPIYLSVGHRMDQEGVLRVTTACISRFRMPEPLRLADKTLREYRKKE
jgi:deoxyribonuclease V